MHGLILTELFADCQRCLCEGHPRSIPKLQKFIQITEYLKDQKTLKSKGPIPLYYESLYGI